MSPEVCESLPYSYKSDIWALGCVLYELCTLKHAFKAKNLLGLVYKIVQEKQEPIPSCYNIELNALCSKLLTKDYKMRPEITEVIQMPFFRKVAENFKSRRGKMDVHIPIKKVNPQELNTIQKIKPNSSQARMVPDDSLSSLTPMERIKKRKQLQADRRAKEIIEYQKSMIKSGTNSQKTNNDSKQDLDMTTVSYNTPENVSSNMNDNSVNYNINDNNVSYSKNDETSATINLKTSTYNKMRISPKKRPSYQSNSLNSSFLPD